VQLKDTRSSKQQKRSSCKGKKNNIFSNLKASVVKLVLFFIFCPESFQDYF
jgi:hypothetical protein